MPSQPRLPLDTRGIVAPVAMVRHVEFTRVPAPENLRGLIDWFWAVRWSLPCSVTHRQEVVSQPGVNLSVGNAPPPGDDPPPGPHPLRFIVNGVATVRTSRVLSGDGWNVAAKTSTGGFGAWVDDVSALTDEVCPAEAVLAITSADSQHVAALVAAALPTGRSFEESVSTAVSALSDLLSESLTDRDQGRINLAREIAALAALVEHDRDLRTVEQLARHAGVSARTLQRRFASCAGVAPTWVIRRFRLLDAAELVRDGRRVDWSQVAVDLGYADQSHLVRDFTATLGVSPQAYALAQTGMKQTCVTQIGMKQIRM